MAKSKKATKPARTSVEEPQEGDPVLIDGFLYELAGTKKELDQDENPILIRSAVRPAPANAKEAAAHQGNFNYKKDFKLLNSDLVWGEPHDLLAEMRDQAAQLARGNPKLKAWADGAAVAQADALEGHPGAWTLPGRHLLKPPGVRKIVNGQPGEFTVVPSDAKTAEAIARAVLAHKHVYDQTKGG